MKKAVFVAVLFACSSTASAPAQVQSVTVKVAFNKELNAKIIVAANGMTLYAGRATCGKGCARFWRPLAVNGCPSAGPGAKASLATRKRPDGIVQVTYAGHPLYSFRPDRKPGDVRGAGFQASWYVLSHIAWLQPFTDGGIDHNRGRDCRRRSDAGIVSVLAVQ